MPDPRNVAHDKTVTHNKQHAGKPIVPDAAEKPQPGKKPTLKHHAKDEKKRAAENEKTPVSSR